MDDNDFYEDDEPIEEVRAAWKAGEKGTTSGPRVLNQRARSIVDQAVARWDAEPDPVLPKDVERQVLVFGKISEGAEQLDFTATSALLASAGSRT